MIIQSAALTKPSLTPWFIRPCAGISLGLLDSTGKAQVFLHSVASTPFTVADLRMSSQGHRQQEWQSHQLHPSAGEN